jgi:hypothetical protein
MSVTILIGSTSVQHLALLKRAMQFSVVYANDVFARVVATVVSIYLGWAGWGYWERRSGVLLPRSPASDGVRFVPQSKVYYRASGSGSMSYIGLRKKNGKRIGAPYRCISRISNRSNAASGRAPPV